ncbi:hypothetical protein [Larkinella rosea]|uniref:Uncharacterized protein n=1 Tax=Larkinella rosea TaxID=2025312 RepID=A0A3P1BC56_9BACT|nr:hypothetical protein [Larkinella rosea]RRA98608.1 hypothetical protein EHT25_26750 [Larkinella rosea]
MEKEDKVDSVYLKGFNEGYIIAQNMPELAEVLANVKSDSMRLNGLKAGREQYNKEQIEQLKTHLPSWLKGDRLTKGQDSTAKSKDRDNELDKD